MGETGVPLENASVEGTAKPVEVVEADTAVAMGEVFGSMSHRINTQHKQPVPRTVDVLHLDAAVMCQHDLLDQR